MSNCNKTFRDLIESGQAQILGIVSEVPMGDWNATTTYQKLNFVRHNGATYKAKTSNVNIEPGVASNWQDVWMLCNNDGGLVSPDGTYPNMTAGKALALNKFEVTLSPSQWQNNEIVLTATEYPALSYVTNSTFPAFIADDASAQPVVENELSIALTSDNNVSLSCQTTPTTTISGIIILY